MAETTKIAWADATVNWWIGCTKVSAACDNCYAEAFAKRTGRATWGHGEARSRCTGAADLARRLNRKAQREGRRLKVFTNSLSDFFDQEVPDLWRDEACAEMARAEHLDWLVLTKRPQVAHRYADAAHRCGEHWLAGIDGAPAAQWPLPNVWLGTTAEDQKMYDLRWPILKGTPAAVHFISYEPALAPLDYVWGKPDWIIVGGESGPRARPFDLAWAREVRDQCKASDVAFFMKQLGAKPYVSPWRDGATGYFFTPAHKAGADPSEWPVDLRIQEFPHV